MSSSSNAITADQVLNLLETNLPLILEGFDRDQRVKFWYKLQCVVDLPFRQIDGIDASEEAAVLSEETAVLSEEAAVLPEELDELRIEVEGLRTEALALTKENELLGQDVFALEQENQTLKDEVSLLKREVDALSKETVVAPIVAPAVVVEAPIVAPAAVVEAPVVAPVIKSVPKPDPSRFYNKSPHVIVNFSDVARALAPICEYKDAKALLNHLSNTIWDLKTKTVRPVECILQGKLKMDPAIYARAIRTAYDLSVFDLAPVDSVSTVYVRPVKAKPAGK